MTKNVTDLIERLEKATGPDRELDGDIAAALKLHPKGWRRGVKEASATASWWSKDDRDRYDAPPVTKSIDAALTLVLEGWSWNVTGGDLSAEGKPYACIASKDVIGGPEPWLEERDVKEATASTPAIALCIAALRARKEPRS